MPEIRSLMPNTTASHAEGLATLASILLLSLFLNLSSIGWGTPGSWHPDEIHGGAVGLINDRTLNPHFFPYGALHYYVLAIVAVGPVGVYHALFDAKPPLTDVAALDAWRDRKNSHLTIAARAVSGVMGTLLVLITFLIASKLLNRRAALLAALFLAVCPFFVEIAHFSIVDTAANFWFWLACLFSLGIWQTGERRWYVLAALTAGLAIGVKVDRAVVVVPLLCAHWLAPAASRAKPLRLMNYALLVPVAYVIANPTLLLSPFEFLDGTSRDLFLNIIRTAGTTSYGAMLNDMRYGMGLPLLLVAAAGLLFLWIETARDRQRGQAWWITATILPMYLIFGSKFAQAWYTPFFFPALAICAAYAVCRALLAAQMHPRALQATWLATALVAGWSGLQSVAVTEELRNDARYLAARWIRETIPADATVEIGPRGPQLLDPVQKIVVRTAMPADFYAFTDQWRANLLQHRLYQWLRSHILSLERDAAARFGFRARAEPYRAWFDLDPQPAAVTPVAPTATPDYKVLVDYIDESEVAQLDTPESGYELIAHFSYTHPLRQRGLFPFVNPDVLVFRRRGVTP